MRLFALVIATSALVAAAERSETVTYDFDARGRLVEVARTGSESGGSTTTYTFDAADNRLTATTTTAPGGVPAASLFEQTLRKASSDYGADGWNLYSNYPRTLGDINGDGRADIVGFGETGTYASLAQADGTFASINMAVAEFGRAAPAGGWSSFDRYPRMLADVNGDGAADVVGFGGEKVWVALATGTGGFGTLTVASAEFIVGWDSQDTSPRLLGDVNADGRADIVGFGADGTYVALANANGTFGSAILAPSEFGRSAAAGGWASMNLYPRALADANGDQRADIVGFGEAGVWVGLGNSQGSFYPAQKWVSEFGVNAGGWVSSEFYPRLVADVNGDDRADIVGLGKDAAYVSLADGQGQFTQPALALREFATAAGAWTGYDQFPRMLADVNGDGLSDIVGFGENGVFLSLAGR